MSNRIIVILATFLSSGFQALAQTNAPLELVSKPLHTRTGTFGDSGDIELSADGRWAVFASNGNGIVTNDSNGFELDVFLRNQETGEITMISRNAELNNGGNGNSFGATISSDGQFILFESEADDLVEGDENESSDVFLYDRITADLTILSQTTNGIANGASGASSMTSDGRFVLFESTAGNFSEFDTNSATDLYLLERETGTIQLVSVNSNNTASAVLDFPSDVGGAFEGSVSADGRYVAFVGVGSNYVPGVPANSPPQIYLRDMTSGTNVWLTRTLSGTGSPVVSSPVVSSDGAFVTFLASGLTNLVASLNDPVLFLYEIATGERKLIRSPQFLTVEDFALSQDGRFIAFTSSNQVFLHDISAWTNGVASIAPNGLAASGVTGNPKISADGRFTVFTSSATNLVDGTTNEFFQIYRFDRETGEVALLSRAIGGAGEANADAIFPTISGDGTIAAFASYASNLVTNDNWLVNDVFVVSTSGTNEVKLASVPQASSVSTTASGSSFLENQAISLDGRYVIFSSQAADLVAGDTNEVRDIFLRDLLTGSTRRVTDGANGLPFTGFITPHGASLDGATIAFSATQEVSGTNRKSAFIYSVATDTNAAASLFASGDVVAPAEALLSPSGRYLGFRETPTTSSIRIRDLRDEVTLSYVVPAGMGSQMVAFSPRGKYLITRNSGSQVAVHDWKNNRFVTNLTHFGGFVSNAITADDASLLVNRPGMIDSSTFLTVYSLDGTRSNIVVATNATPLAISADGSAVAYLLRDPATNSVGMNLYFYDVANDSTQALMLGGTNVLVRIRNTSSISADGRFFAFSSPDSLTGVPDEIGASDIYVYDRVLNQLHLVTRNDGGQEGNAGSSSPYLSANGQVLVFDSAASDLIVGDNNFSSDVFLARLARVDSDTDGLEDGWETIYLGGLNATAEADTDGDGITNLDEFRAGTDPNDAASTLRTTLELEEDGETMVLITPAVPGNSYRLQHRVNLTDGDWQDIGQSVVAFSNSVRFDVPVDLQANGFFRIRTLE